MTHNFACLAADDSSDASFIDYILQCCTGATLVWRITADVGFLYYLIYYSYIHGQPKPNPPTAIERASAVKARGQTVLRK
jgi:hypothetical protein